MLIEFILRKTIPSSVKLSDDLLSMLEGESTGTDVSSSTDPVSVALILKSVVNRLKAELSFISNLKSFWDFANKNKNGNNLLFTVHLNGIFSTNSIGASELFSKYFSSVFLSVNICAGNTLCVYFITCPHVFM